MTGKESERIRRCQFVPDFKPHTDPYWFCTVHHGRVSNPLVACFSSRYVGAELGRKAPPGDTAPVASKVRRRRVEAVDSKLQPRLFEAEQQE
jgi:hypothetical protein